MGAGEQDLTLRAQLKGGEETAKGLDKIADGEKKVGGQVGETAKATDQAEGAQRKLNAAEGDYVGILSRIHPSLGALADSMLKGSKIAGDLASQNINLTGAFEKATEAIKGNAGALKLIGAAGAVAAGIWLIVRALRAEREERERLAKAIKAQSDAMNELKQEEKDEQAAIERLRDASRQGPFSAEEARAAAETAQDIAERSPFIEREAVNRAVAAFGGRAGELGGGAFNIEQLERIAQLVQTGQLELPSDVSAGGAKTLAERALERHADRLDTIFAREAEQKRESLQEAGKQGGGSGGATIDLEAFIRKHAPAGTDAARMAELWQRYQTLAGLLPIQQGVDPETGRRKLATAADVPAMPGDLFRSGTAKTGTAEERHLLEILMQLFEGQRRRDAEGEGAKATQEPQTVIHNQYHNQHSRNVYPDARATRAATINGESDKMRRGVG